jgi:hypothetical protein
MTKNESFNDNWASSISKIKLLLSRAAIGLPGPLTIIILLFADGGSTYPAVDDELKLLMRKDPQNSFDSSL